MFAAEISLCEVGLQALSPSQRWVPPRLAPDATFPTLSTGCKFSRSRRRMQLFSFLATDVVITALGNGRKFSRARHWMQLFPCWVLNATLLALGTGCKFSSAWRQVFLVFEPVCVWF